MRKALTALAMLAGLTAATGASAAPILTAGFNPEFSGDAAVRYRSFNNTGGQEAYLGVADLGVAANRAAQNYTWQNGATNFSFTIDLANDLLTSQLPGANALTRAYASNPIINAFKVSSVDRDVDGELWLTNLVVNGASLGDVTSSESEGFLDFMVTGVDVANLYTVTGTINRSGFFTNSQDLSRIEIQAGYIAPPAVPLPAAAWMLIAGLGGLAAFARRKAA